MFSNANKKLLYDIQSINRYNYFMSQVFSTYFCPLSLHHVLGARQLFVIWLNHQPVSARSCGHRKPVKCLPHDSNTQKFLYNQTTELRVNHVMQISTVTAYPCQNLELPRDSYMYNVKSVDSWAHYTIIFISSWHKYNVCLLLFPKIVCQRLKRPKVQNVKTPNSQRLGRRVILGLKNLENVYFDEFFFDTDLQGPQEHY